MFLFSTTTERPDAVQTALRQASSSTGVDFDYLLKTAQRESSLDPKAKASTSSATGLFQFIESTWLAVLKEAGPKHGYGDAANGIEARSGGGFTVADGGLREEILALRQDPKAAALMAGELALRNAQHLESILGRAPTSGELYMAHFLGAKGAGELVRLAEKIPDAPAAAHFEAAAHANPGVFYKIGGQSRTVREVYVGLAGGHEAAKPAALAEGSGSEDLLVYETPSIGSDRIFQSLFSDGPAAAAGLGPLGRAVGSFWTGFYGSPEAGEQAPEPLWAERKSHAGHVSGQGEAEFSLWRDPSARP